MKRAEKLSPNDVLISNSDPNNIHYYNEGDKYKAIFENAAHGFLLSTPNGNILEANPAAARIFEYTADELRDLKMWQLIDHKDPLLLVAFETRERTGFATTEATGIRKNGERFIIELSSAIFIDVDGMQKCSTMISDISKRKLMEAAMQLSNERFDLVTKATNDLIWDWDLITGDFYRYNENLETVYGHRKNDSIKNFDLWKEYLHPLDKERVCKQIEEYINSSQENVFNFEYRFRRQDGDYAYINDKGCIIRNKKGKAIRMIGAAENITEKKKAEVALADSEARLRMLIQTNPECIKLISKDGQVLEVNPAGLAMLQADSLDQVIGNKACNLILPEYKKPYEEMVRNVLAGNSVRFDFRMRGLKGRELWLESHAVPFRNSQGEITALQLVTRDITQNKNAQARLFASEESYKYLFDNNPASIIIWDINTLGILEVNETASKLYGYTKEAFQKLSMLDIRPPKDHPKFLDFVELIRNNEVDKKLISRQHLTSDGDIIIMDVSTHNIQYKDRKAVLSIGNDITRKVQLENSLNEERQIRQQQITEAVITGQEKERTQLGEELHDNINQVLASTKLFIECAMRNDTGRNDLLEESKHLVEKAMIEIRQLSKSLLPPSLGEVGLQQALTEMAESITQVKPLSIKINWQLQDENKLSSKLKLTIFRIVQEQLNNVIKHADAKNAFISISKSMDVLHISVKDDGVGFDTSVKGKGVGLRNITSRADVNNGVAYIESRPGGGCELSVNFVLRQ